MTISARPAVSPGPDATFSGTPLEDASVGASGARRLRVAVASETGENVDGHFGACPHFLIFEVDTQGFRLVEARETQTADATEDRDHARAALIGDCQILLVHAIGGPAAAKVVRAGVHPLKWPSGGPAEQALDRLRAVVSAPPPWLAKALGRVSPVRATWQ